MPQTAFQYDDAFDPSLWDPSVTTRLLAEHGLDRDLVDLESLRQRASSDDSPLPPPLIEALYRIHDLANDAGHDALFAMLYRRGCIDDTVDRTPADLALLAWLDHRDVFERVHARHVVPLLGSFRIFRSRAARPLVVDEEQRVGLERVLGAAFRRRGLGSSCRVTVEQESHRFELQVRRGLPCRRIGIVDGDDSASIAFRPRQIDRLFYDARTGLLRVLASDAATVRTYRRAAERVLFAEDGFLEEHDVLSLQPLIDHGPGALLPVAGLREVRLRELELRVADPEHEATVRVVGNDVLAVLEHYGRVRISDGEPISVTFGLVPTTGVRPRFLHLSLPNGLVYDWRRDDPLPFLEERGFLRGLRAPRGRLR